jgi:hypothetical protein
VIEYSTIRCLEFIVLRMFRDKVIECSQEFNINDTKLLTF